MKKLLSLVLAAMMLFSLSAVAMAEDEAGFDAYMERFTACIPAQKAAVEGLKI